MDFHTTCSRLPYHCVAYVSAQVVSCSISNLIFFLRKCYLFIIIDKTINKSPTMYVPQLLQCQLCLI